mgnify:CR=1 FL=1
MHKEHCCILFSSQQVAAYLCIKENTLRRSRVTGKLFGIAAPLHLKIGTAVRYNKAVLELWVQRNSVKKSGMITFKNYN